MPNCFRNLSLFCLFFGFLLLSAHHATAQEWGEEDWVVIYTAAEEPGAMTDLYIGVTCRVSGMRCISFRFFPAPAIRCLGLRCFQKKVKLPVMSL
jgi:hypothetical protein